MTDESPPRRDEPRPTVRLADGRERRAAPGLLDRVAPLFEQARHLDSTARAGFIAARTEHDAELRAELERLLAHAGAPGLDTKARDGIARAATDAMDGGTLDRIGRYRLLRRLGEGGMGTVFEAEQDEPRRRVALKLVRRDLASPEILRRFRTETEALGRLSHPGIGQIFEAGVVDLPGGRPQPFFAMELIEGASLLAHVRERGLGTSERLELLAQVCDAVQHAHRRGIVHRDLKPDNVLVTGDGRIKVLDFGVARATAGDLATQTLQTTAGEILGTVPYMSPEQVGGRPEAIDHRSDVYSLGVIAFELVSERRPYAVERLGLPEAARVIRDDEPTALGTLDSRWRGDVETIIGKALEKDPDRRYQSAADMAEDIRRFLRHDPITARPPSAAYRLGKFARRNKSLVAGVAGVMLALAMGTAVATRQALEAARQRDLAEASRQRALHQAYRASLAAAQAALREGEASARQLLVDAPEALRGWEWTVLHEQLNRSVRSLASTSEDAVEEITLDADGRTLATVSRAEDGRAVLAVEDLESGRMLQSFALSDRPVRVRAEDLDLARRHARFRPGEREIEYVDAETGARLRLDRRCGDVRLGASVNVLSRDVAYIHPLESVEEHPDTLACDLRTGRTLSTADDHGHGAFSPDGRHAALAGGIRVVVYEVATGKRIATLEDGRDDARRVFYVLGGRRIATVSWNGFVRQWDASDYRLVEKHQLSTNMFVNAAVTKDGARMAVCGADPRVRIWNLRDARDAGAFYAPAAYLAFSENGRFLAAVGAQDTHVFDVSDDGDMSVLRGHASYVYPVIFDRDGARIWSGSWDGTARAWDAETHEPIAALTAGTNVLALSVSPDGGRIAASDVSAAREWDTGTGRLVASSDEVGYVAWGSDGLLRGMGRRTELTEDSPAEHDVQLDPESLAILPARDVTRLEGVPSPDGAWIALGRDTATLSIGSAREGGSPDPVRTLEVLPGEETFKTVRWSTDGSRLVAAGGGRLLAWDAADWRKIADVVAHARRVNAAAFSPDGRLLATGGGDGVVRAWDAATMEPLLELRGHSAYVWSVAWSPDGTQLVSGSGDGTLRAWDSVPLRDRWHAREERRRDMEALRPIVERLFAEQGGDADRVLALVREKYPAGDASASRLRRAALDVVLQASLARLAAR